MSDPTAADTGWTWYRPMRARSADERARSSTELELLFDLCFVIAVAQAAAAFEHEVTSGRIGHGVLGYAMVFFAIWWAWMNFTWFASAYDTDDVFYRLLTLVQIGGALIMAAGAARALDDSDFVLVAMGYVVMRLAMVAQWLRAAYSDRERRTSSLRYAAGIFLIQIGWVIVAFGVIPDLPVAFVVLAVGELAIPPWAERTAPTTWHPQHIAERFGLFTLIVLGETVAAAAAAMRAALDTDVSFGDVASLSIGGLVTVFAMWWLYFAFDSPSRLTSLAASLRWGYGHYALFASAAAVGAGLSVNIAEATGHVEISRTAVAAAYTIPVAVYLTALALLRRGSKPSGTLDAMWALALLGLLAATFADDPVLITGLVTAALVAGVVTYIQRNPAR
ncbi:low temperature requirement protein A [Streptomyces sp. NBC_01716]|uniref:low temperature requirement protein A n=1 Tax=Streptomyces sp. NBC_01716 TaxID=2975917 RepID=UPI002E35393F|nr:low temperature requirement protein A [Streptomyces sp. NBC_01716]